MDSRHAYWISIGVVMLLATTGCSGDSDWFVEFDSVADRDRSELVEAVVFRGGCVSSEVIARYELRRDEAFAPASMSFDSTTVGLSASARGVDCMETARGCIEADLPGDGRLVVPMTTQSAEVYGCPGRVCLAGACGAGPGPQACSLGGRLPGLALGATAACALAGDCSAFCWGDGGSVPVATTLSPVRVASEHSIQQLALGDRHSCHLQTDGQAFCTGSGESGQLGAGTTASSPSPTRVGELRYTMLAAAADHTCGVALDGGLYCWGMGAPVVGSVDGADVLAPVRLGTGEFAFVTVGRQHACAIDRSGSLLCWGDNSAGQLGVAAPASSPEPLVVSETKWASVSAGATHTCAIDRDSQLHCWGDNTDDRLGGATIEASVPAPTRVGTSNDWQQVAAGPSHSCGVRSDGTLWCWGDNDRGQLAARGVGRFSVPTQIGTSVFTSVAVGDGYTCGRDVIGVVLCWGANDGGRLGIGTDDDRDRPTRVL